MEIKINIYKDPIHEKEFISITCQDYNFKYISLLSSENVDKGLKEISDLIKEKSNIQ